MDARGVHQKPQEARPLTTRATKEQNEMRLRRRWRERDKLQVQRLCRRLYRRLCRRQQGRDKLQEKTGRGCLTTPVHQPPAGLLAALPPPWSCWNATGILKLHRLVAGVPGPLLKPIPALPPDFSPPTGHPTSNPAGHPATQPPPCQPETACRVQDRVPGYHQERLWRGGAEARRSSFPPLPKGPQGHISAEAEARRSSFPPLPKGPQGHVKKPRGSPCQA